MTVFKGASITSKLPLLYSMYTEKQRTSQKENLSSSLVNNIINVEWKHVNETVVQSEEEHDVEFKDI